MSDTHDGTRRTILAIGPATGDHAFEKEDTAGACIDGAIVVAADDDMVATVVDEGQVLHPMVEAAIAAGPSPDVLRDLLDLQRTWESDQAKKAFTRALVGLKRDLPNTIHKDKTVDFRTSKGRTHYTHTSLAAVMDAVTDILSSHGFSLRWPGTIAGPSMKEVTVTCQLTHRDGHSDTCTISSPPDTSGSKGPAQAIASTITLLERYTALALLGIATADMSEPHGPRPKGVDPKSVNPKRNLKAAQHIESCGRSVDDAETIVGKPSIEWTASDLDTLHKWLKKEGP